jgi:FemAB-related protein (PEP-CTERM system-associated)
MKAIIIEISPDKKKPSQDMKIRHAKVSDIIRWDDFVQRHPESSPYHLYAWAAAVEAAYGFKNVNLIAEIENRVVGVLPLVIMNIPLMRPTIIALPYCDIGGVLAEDDMIKKALVEAGLEEGKKWSTRLIEIRCEIPNYYKIEGGTFHQANSGKVRMLLQLPPTSEELWNGFKSKLRSQIRKAEKNGLTFEIANEKIDEFYSVFSRNMRDLGSPVHSQKWFKEIIKYYGNNMNVCLVYSGNRAIGAAIILRVGKKTSIPWASTLREYNSLSPNMLLYWEILRYSVENGVESFDFGRSTPNEGTYRFKAQWGAIPKELPWNRMYFYGESNEAKAGISKLRTSIEAVWQKLPLLVVNFLGPKIRKYISL